MEARSTTSTLRFYGRIDQRTHDISDLKSEYPNWDDMDDEEKLKASRDVDPIDEETVYNVTTDKFHQYVVDNLDPDQTAAKDNVSASWLALGTDSGTGTDTTDTDLNARAYSETVTDHADNGKELLASTFLDSTEGNGDTFNEIGLFTGDPANISNPEIFMLNHATFSDVPKDNTKTVTFDVTLTFSDV